MVSGLAEKVWELGVDGASDTDMTGLELQQELLLALCALDEDEILLVLCIRTIRVCFVRIAACSDLGDIDARTECL